MLILLKRICFILEIILYLIGLYFPTVKILSFLCHFVLPFIHFTMLNYQFYGPNLGGPNQVGPNQGGPNQAGSNQVGLNQVGPNQGGPNLTGNNLAGNKINLAGNELSGPILARSDVSGPNLAGNNLAGNRPNLAGNTLSGEIMITIDEKTSDNELLLLRENNSSADFVKNNLDESILGKYK